MDHISNVCFLCDHPAKPLSGNGSLNQRSNIFEKLNVKIDFPPSDQMDVMCANCTSIMDEIYGLRNEVNLLTYLVQRQIRRKYKAECHGTGEKPSIDLLNKLDLMAVKSFKFLSNDYICMKCSFKTPFQDTLVPHFKFHTICEKNEGNQDVMADCDDDLIEYDLDYEDELDDLNDGPVECNDPEIEKQNEPIANTDHNSPEQQIKDEVKLLSPFKDALFDKATQSDTEKNKSKFCNNCGFLIEPNVSCSHYKAILKGYIPKKCSKCNEEFYKDHLLLNHLKQVHFECDICLKTFSNNTTLRRHKYSHKSGAMYTCFDCDKQFKTRSGLFYHLPKHTGNYSYYCQICNKGVMSEKFLEEHMRTHTKVNKYECDVCGTKFIHNSTYRLHRLWHDNPLPYECNECGIKFSHTSKLAIHRRREHTGERPYKCNDCPKTFFDSTSLKSHQRIHSQTHSYKCHTCNVNFNTKLEQITHMQKTHSRHPNHLEKRNVCKYKVALRPEYNKVHHITEDGKTDKFTNGDEDNESLQDYIIEFISNDDSKLEKNLIYSN